MAHGRIVCTCGALIAQCRCMGPHGPDEVRGPCTHAPASGAEVGGMIKVNEKVACETCGVEGTIIAVLDVSYLPTERRCVLASAGCVHAQEACRIETERNLAAARAQGRAR